jgi:hypothetical protein
MRFGKAAQPRKGWRPTSEEGLFRGLLDSISIWNSALSTDCIQELAFRRLAGIEQVRAVPVGLVVFVAVVAFVVRFIFSSSCCSSLSLPLPHYSPSSCCCSVLFVHCDRCPCVDLAVI